MSRFEMNKGWKIFGVSVVLILVAVGVFCAVVGIMSGINHVSFVDQFMSIFGMVKTPVDPPVDAQTIIKMII